MSEALNIRTYRISVPTFMKHQSDKLGTLKSRKAILIAKGINLDHKMLALHGKRDHTLMPLLVEIWLNVSADTQTYEVRSDHFDYWCRKTFCLGNKASVKDKLISLEKLGFIQFQEVSFSPEDRSESSSHQGSITPLCDPYKDSINLYEGSIDSTKKKHQIETRKAALKEHLA